MRTYSRATASSTVHIEPGDPFTIEARNNRGLPFQVTYINLSSHDLNRVSVRGPIIKTNGEPGLLNRDGIMPLTDLPSVLQDTIRDGLTAAVDSLYGEVND